MRKILICLFFVGCGRLAAASDNRKADSLRIALSTSSDTGRVRVLSMLASELKSAETEKALSYAMDALSLSRDLAYKRGIAMSYFALAEIHHVLNKRDVALNYFHKSLGLYIDQEDKPHIAEIYFQIGAIHKEISNYTISIEYFAKSASLFKLLKNNDGYSKVNNALGTVYYSQGNYTEALRHILISLKIAEYTGNKTRIAYCYNNIGNIHLKKGEFNLAMMYYRNALIIKEALGAKASIAAAYGNIGTVYYSLHNFDSAMYYFNYSLKISMSQKDKRSIAIACANIGLVYTEKKEYQNAIEFLYKSLEIEKELGNKAGAAESYLYISSLYSKLNRHNEAIKYANKGLVVAEQIDAKEKIRGAYSLLAEIYEKLNDYRTANQFYKKLNTIKDSLVNVESNKQADALEAKYKSESTQKQIELLKQDRTVQRLKLSQNRTIIYSALVLLILALILTFVILQSNRQKQRTNELLRKQNDDIRRQKDEKDVMLKEIHHRVKNNLQIINSLMRLQSNYVSDQRILDLFDECQNRVISMALIHEQLYESKNLSGIEIRNYIETLTNSLLKTYRLNVNIALDIKLDVSRFGIDTLIPLGLLINEVLSNSLKYAFENRASGKIIFALKRLEGATFELTIGDDGIGMPADFDLTKENPTLGLELIKTFVQQLEGNIEHLKDSPGTLFKIIFKSLKKEDQFQ